MRVKRCAVSMYGLGIIFTIFGIILIIHQPQATFIMNKIRERVVITEGTFGYKEWKDFIIEFRVHLFHVSNPDEVMLGGLPQLVEYGPYVYDAHREKIILNIDDAQDSIEYTLKRSLYFNKEKTGDLSEEDKITILNPAYIGTILTMAASFPAFVGKMGNNIPLLFPNQKSIFVSGTVKEILFDGLPLACNSEKYPQLKLICSFLKGKKPPILRDTDVEGAYIYSLFSKNNGSIEGPFKMIRGVKNVFQLGSLTSFQGSLYSQSWYVPDCSPIKGTDAITYAPMARKEQRLWTFISDICRTLFADYDKDVVINGLLGYRYATTSNLWNITDNECYCPRDAKRNIACPPTGLLDLSKCQGVPITMSEPHFLHAQSTLLNYAQGLNPDEEAHATYIVIEPSSGVPLAGFKKMQLNLKISAHPVDLLANVTEGYFPLVWVEEGIEPNATLCAELIQAHRLLRLLSFLICWPLLGGLFMILVTLLMNSERSRNIMGK